MSLWFNYLLIVGLQLDEPDSYYKFLLPSLEHLTGIDIKV